MKEKKSTSAVFLAHPVCTKYSKKSDNTFVIKFKTTPKFFI